MAHDAPVLLELDLVRGLREAPPPDPIAALRTRHLPVLADVVERLREAAAAPGVGGLIAHLGGEPITAAQAQELGRAVEAFAAAGKPAVCWTESFGEGGNGTVAYELAASFDEIWLQPSGGLALVGTAAGGTFARGLLRRLGVEPQIHARHEFKNAPDTVMREEMSDAQREALQRLTDSLTEQAVATVVRRRGLAADAVRAAIAAAPLTAAEALEHGLVDRLGYRDEAYASVRRRIAGAGHAATPEADLPAVQPKFVQRWSRPPAELAREQLQRALRARIGARVGRPADTRASSVAVITVEGGIVLGHGGRGPMGGRNTGSDAIGSALRQAAADDDVAAVVLRVVSPGGSYTASDAIHHEVQRVRAGGTPVVASMGSVAASGGYFVAMGCDEIFALPGTLTGSIGVFAGKLVVRDALGRAGVRQELVQTGEQATMWSAARPFDDDELAHLDRWLDEVYDDFTRKAAAGRGMAHDALEPLARGRVWTGADAIERGLVDHAGGLEHAITRAAELAGRERGQVRAKPFPHVPPVARLRTPAHSDAPGASAGGGALATGAAGLALEAIVGHGPERLLAELGAAAGLGPGALRLPPGLVR